MNTEKITTPETNPSENLIERLGEADLTVYEVLNPSNLAEARQEFLANDDMVHPSFEYDNIDPEQISANLASIAKIREQLPTADLEKTHRLTAEISLNDVYWKNEFVAACDRYNHATTPEEKAQAEAEQREANRRLYGEPDEKTFLTLLNEELSKINIENLDDFDREVYKTLLGELGDIPALSHELPGNEEIDEGIAKCCEQAVKGSYQDSGIFHYVNIGLANFKDKNFREVFEIQRMLNYLQNTKPTTSMAEKQALYRKKDMLLFNRTMRCFRGTGTLPNNKDLVYYNGASRVWQYIEQHIDDPTLLDTLFLSGKSNFLDPAQERLIYESKI